MTSRRTFLTGALALGAAPLAFADGPASPRLKKAVKLGMVAGDAPLLEKFKLLKKLGFEGVEIDYPSGIDVAEAGAAQQATGVKIHGVIVSTHWAKPLSDPDAAVRAVTAKSVRDSLAVAGKLGATTVLVVPGVVTKGVTYDECWERSTAEIKALVPAALEANAKIAIEVVWNNFLTKPEQLVKYVDQFDPKAVGAYFDCSNMLRYGVPSQDWIRALGNRMLKFDFKAYSNEKAKAGNNLGAGFDAKIGEGSEDWPAILRACAEVGYADFATAEVGSGGEEFLRDVAERMDRVLGLKG